MRIALLTGMALLAACTTGRAEESCGPRCSKSRACPRPEYTRLHYWTPTLFVVRSHIHPSRLDQYPPGPIPCMPALVEVTRYRCPAVPPMPSSPYADPASYYARPVLTPGETTAPRER